MCIRDRLSTCNRLEIYVDADGRLDRPTLAGYVRAALAGDGQDPGWAEVPLRVRHATEVLWHVFAVGAGLDSMVVGERQIAGQLRRALREARRDGTATYLLTESIEQALRTSRKVAHLTELAEGADAVGVDYRTPLREAAALVPGKPLQGNLDPALLTAPWPTIEAHVRDVVDQGRAAPGHVVNLGHGVPPTTDPDVLTRIVALVHTL